MKISAFYIITTVVAVASTSTTPAAMNEGDKRRMIALERYGTFEKEIKEHYNYSRYVYTHIYNRKHAILRHHGSKIHSKVKHEKVKRSADQSEIESEQIVSNRFSNYLNSLFDLELLE